MQQRVTPRMEELLPNHSIACGQPGCDSIFTNIGNYDLHLSKHHKVQLSRRTGDSCVAYHCPIESCMYNETPGDNAKHFKKLKYLRQHYQKVHIDKTHLCPNCNSRFGTFGLLKCHLEKSCGRKFTCATCSWNYCSMDALRTHGKRKQHAIKREEPQMRAETVKVGIPCLSRKHSPTQELQPRQHAHTQTEAAENSATSTAVLTAKRMRLASVQTETMEANFDNDLDIHLLLRDIETQTELPARHSHSSPNPVYRDHMLSGGGHLAHMHTQTELLSEFGLSSDVETRRTTMNCAHDELLVSTETQTSFTQCLLDSTATCQAQHTAEGSGCAFGSLSQHTQTCDTLLEGFFFGGQESDFIVGLQSTTYTQT